MKKLTESQKVELAVSLIDKSEVFKTEFVKYFISKIGVTKLDKLSIQLNELLLLFIHDKISINQQYKRFSRVESQLYALLPINGNKIPSIIELIIYLQERNYSSKGFSLVDFISILEAEASSKPQVFRTILNYSAQNKTASEKAQIQSKRLQKKDMSGLLGVSNLSKRTIKKTPKHYPTSVWTVKKK